LVLQGENEKFRAKLADYEAMRNENAQLHAELVQCDAIRAENEQLRAKLISQNRTQNENAQLRAKLLELQNIQSKLTSIVDIAERREEARSQASSERRNMLMGMLTLEERQDQMEKSDFLYEGDKLGRAFGRQIQSIDGTRREMLDQVDAKGVDGAAGKDMGKLTSENGDVTADQYSRSADVGGYRNSAFE